MLALAAVLSSAPAGAATLAGNAAIAATRDSNPAGMAEAFQAAASADGTVSKMSVYVDASSTARRVLLGVFADTNGHPSALLATGAVSTPVPGAWNTVAATPLHVTAGRPYWLALLTPAGMGNMVFRDAAGGGRSETSSTTTLSALPATWSTGTVFPDGSLSMILSSDDSTTPVLLTTTPTSLAFSAVAGGANPGAAPLGIANAAGGALAFTSSSSVPWLAVSPASGTAPLTGQVSASTAGLAAGTYSGTLSLSTSGPPASVTVVPVSLTLAPPVGALSVSPAGFSLSATANAANVLWNMISISSSGGAALAFTATSNQPWLTVFPTSGTTPSSNWIRVATTGLSAGTHVGQIVITPTGAGSAAAVAIPVTLTVDPVVVLTHAISGTVSPASLGAGATVSLSGAAARTTTTDGAGNFAFSAVPDGSYQVTPSHAGTVFSPSALGVVVNGADVAGVNFTAASNAATLFFDDFTGSALGSAWTIVKRRGPAGQDENECNTAGAVGVADGLLTITTSATPATCGDAVSSPTVLPFTSGDIQWTSLNFTYGTVEVRAKFPPRNTGTWPAFWLLGANCQAANLTNGSEATAFNGCPAQETPGYREIDAVECDARSWCHMVVAQGTAGWSNMCSFPVDANWHVFKLTWTASATSMAVDGVATGCSFANTGLNGPMFLIIQTQTTNANGVSGLPDASHLPTTLQVDYVKVSSP